MVLLSLGCWFCFSCAGPIQQASQGIELGPEFWQQRWERDSDRESSLNLSSQLYTDSKTCREDPSCERLCPFLFSFDFEQETCLDLPSGQVFSFELLYENLLKRDLFYLQRVSAFNLKLFLNVSAEPVWRIFRTLGLKDLQIFLRWITGDWQIAKILREEDEDFLLLDFFLNRREFSPINSLQEPVFNGRNLVELAWLKQNDFILFWLGDYLHDVHCLESVEEEAAGAGIENRAETGTGIEVVAENQTGNQTGNRIGNLTGNLTGAQIGDQTGGDAENQTENHASATDCLLSQLCLLSSSLQEDVSAEIMEFEGLKSLIRSSSAPENWTGNLTGNWTGNLTGGFKGNFKNFCRLFCSANPTYDCAEAI